MTLASEQPKTGDSFAAEVSDPDGGVSNTTWMWESSQDMTAWAAIGGAESSAYVPTADDADSYLRVTASYDDAEGPGKSAMAVSANAVMGPPATPTPVPTVPPTATPAPTAPPAPTATARPAPTATSAPTVMAPTATAEPTATPAPTVTPVTPPEEEGGFPGWLIIVIVLIIVAALAGGYYYYYYIRPRGAAA